MMHAALKSRATGGRGLPAKCHVCDRPGARIVSAPSFISVRFNAHIEKIVPELAHDWTRFARHHRLSADREEIVGLEGGLSVYAILLLPFHGDVTLITTFAT